MPSLDIHEIFCVGSVVPHNRCVFVMRGSYLSTPSNRTAVFGIMGVAGSIRYGTCALGRPTIETCAVRVSEQSLTRLGWINTSEDRLRSPHCSFVAG